MARLLFGDCRDILRLMGDATVDAIVTDPPYELGFMGKAWDASGIAYNVDLWRELFRVLKPGGHLIAFGATRTYHRMACAIEDAGFEIRDSLHWIYATGWPKSTDLAKAADKRAGIWRGRAGDVVSENGAMSGGNYVRTPKGDPVTEAAWNWNGWGSALKPSHEPFILARKDFTGTLVDCVLSSGVGGLHIDACRHEGKWPMNVILSHDSACGAECVPECPIAQLEAHAPGAAGYFPTIPPIPDGSFRYVKKPGKEEKAAGCGDNPHPTVKPTALMDWCIRLVAPHGGTVLDPFMGSGSTGISAINCGRHFIGIEQDPDFYMVSRARIAHAVASRD